MIPSSSQPLPAWLPLSALLYNGGAQQHRSDSGSVDKACGECAGKHPPSHTKQIPVVPARCLMKEGLNPDCQLWTRGFFSRPAVSSVCADWTDSCLPTQSIPPPSFFLYVLVRQCLDVHPCQVWAQGHLLFPHYRWADKEGNAKGCDGRKAIASCWR